jgi:hypothetical protein
MAHLDKLTITRRILGRSRSRRVSDTVEHRRRKIIANLEEQIELAKLALEGKPLVLRRKRGHGVVTVRPRLWWKVDESGQVAMQVLYNKIPVVLAGRGSTVEVGTLKKLPSTCRALIRAVEAGELDDAVEAILETQKASGARAPKR